MHHIPRLHHHHLSFLHEYIKANNIITSYQKVLANLGTCTYLAFEQIIYTHIYIYNIASEIRTDVHSEHFRYPIDENQTSHVCNQLLIKYDFYK